MTHAIIKRSNPVSSDEEFDGFEKIMNANELGDLYEQNQIIDNSKNKIIILGYHQIRKIKNTDSQKAKLFITSPETFDKEMSYLHSNGYHSVPFSEYVDDFNSGNLKGIPEKSFIITFDDGYVSQYNEALPVLKKNNFSGTFFIYSYCVDKYPICLTSEEIKTLANNGMKIANHTLHHVYLPEYGDELIKKEVNLNEEKLISIVGTSSVENVFAYPYGANDGRVRKIIKDLGYSGAVGVLPEKESTTTDIYNLRRYLLGNDLDFFMSLFK
ncbi:MAG: polysaccharide deacetylase family protein [Candidatus Nomurabacteria bacterium]